MNCGLCQQNPGKLIKPGDCAHQFCQPCISKYLKEEINLQRCHYITCPSCKFEYQKETIKTYCPTHKYINLKQHVFICCTICSEDVEIHLCQQEICKMCGTQHKGGCKQRCPKCLNPIEKQNNCNQITCKCKYQFCWICKSKITPSHYWFWNIFGCPIPQSETLNIMPLKYPQIMRYLMILPKVVLAPFFLLYYIFMVIIFCFVALLIVTLMILDCVVVIVFYQFYAIGKSIKEIRRIGRDLDERACARLILFSPLICVLGLFYFLYKGTYFKSSPFLKFSKILEELAIFLGDLFVYLFS